MTIETQKCQTCGRRPSERTDIVLAGETTRKCVLTPLCTDPIHDAADRGPDAVALLRLHSEWSILSATCPRCADTLGPGNELPEKQPLCEIHALLASLPVKP